MKDGFKYMKDSDYFEVEAVSNSFLINFDKSSAHALHGIEQTPSMKKGSLIHSIILDNEFDENYHIVYCENKRCSEYKEAKLIHPDKNIILQKELEKIKKIKTNILEYELLPGFKFNTIFNNKDKIRKEVCAFYFDEEFKLWLKGKLDLYFVDKSNPMIFDLKKTTDAFKKDNRCF
jgi:hypothetical protein